MSWCSCASSKCLPSGRAHVRSNTDERDVRRITDVLFGVVAVSPDRPPPCLESVSEPRQTGDDLLTLIGQSVVPTKVEDHGGRGQDDDSVTTRRSWGGVGQHEWTSSKTRKGKKGSLSGIPENEGCWGGARFFFVSFRKNLRQSGVDAGVIGGKILGPEGQGADDASDGAHAGQGGAAKGAGPMAADVVGLPRQHAGDGGVAAGGDEEDGEELYAGDVGPGQQTQAGDGLEHVDEDDRAPEAVPVAQPGLAVHLHGGEDVRRRGEDLRHAGAEADPRVQNHGKEVGDGVSRRGRASMRPKGSMSVSLRPVFLLPFLPPAPIHGRQK